MQFLTISRFVGTAAAGNEDLAQQETERARLFYSQGRIRQLWHRADGPGACVLWEADSEEELREMLQSLPYMKAGLVEVSVVALRPYRGFGPAAAS